MEEAGRTCSTCEHYVPREKPVTLKAGSASGVFHGECHRGQIEGGSGTAAGLRPLVNKDFHCDEGKWKD
jgi:hypothetical protein